MNRINNLPDDLQIKIYEKVHKHQYRECLKEMMLFLRDGERNNNKYHKNYTEFFTKFLKDTNYIYTDNNELEIHIPFNQLRDGMDYKLQEYIKYIYRNISYTKIQKDIYKTIYLERLTSFCIVII